MISERARQGFEDMVMQGIRTGMTSSPHDACEISLEEELEISGADSRVVMLTVASFVFRIMFFIHFTDDDKTREFFAALSKKDVSALDDQAFIDAVCECGNMCCGTLNRELVKAFPHVGMSTPNILYSRSVDHVKALRPGYLQHLRTVVNMQQTFWVTICVSEFADLDFEVDVTQVETTGELEMF